MEYEFGYFNESGNEFVITNPDIPRAFDNFLWNKAMFSNLQHTGTGYFDYQVGKNEAVQLFTGIGRICDFDVFGRDHLMSRLIYMRDNDTGEYWNVNWEPVRKKYDHYECIHGMGYTVIKMVVNGIKSEFKVFVPIGDDPVELWTLKTVNLSNRKRNLSIFIYNQFQFKFKWGFDSYGDMVYRTSWFNEELNAVVATKHPYRRPHNFLTGFLTADRPIQAFDGTREAFVGVYNTLKEPNAVVRGFCSNTPGSADATIGAAQFNLELEEENFEEMSVIIGATDDERNIEGFRNKYFGKIETYFSQLKEEKKVFSDKNMIKTPDEHFDRILNYWVKQGALYGSEWCRWGWNGYRDIVQQAFGVSSLKSERTREIILEALGYQYSNGLALRGWNPIDEKPYSDSALWMVFTLISYLKETGDLELLNVVVNYYDGGSATVQQHIEQTLNFIEANKGSHELILIKYGDWNDSLTAVGKEGRGESVWLSLAYAEATRQMADLAHHMGDKLREEDFLERRKNIIDAINKNAWDGNWYSRCFDDNGTPVGSKINRYGKIFMEPQCWALISGTADKERAEALLNSCDEILGTEVGYLLLAPTFREIDQNIGRISSMEPGIAENGTIYSHLNVWMILGLLKYGKADKAYEVFKKITPGYVKDGEDVKQKTPPYMYANCYFGPDHKNNKFQMEFTWITGSVAWFNHVLLDYMIGARAEFAGLKIDPCIPSEWEECSVVRNYRGSSYNINIKNPEKLQKGNVQLILDGKNIEGNVIPVFNDGKTHEVVATIIK